MVHVDTMENFRLGCHRHDPDVPLDQGPYDRKHQSTVVAQLEQVFEEDLKYARKIEYQQWRGRGFFSQFLELLSLPIRQQL